MYELHFVMHLVVAIAILDLYHLLVVHPCVIIIIGCLDVVVDSKPLSLFLSTALATVSLSPSSVSHSQSLFPLQAVLIPIAHFLLVTLSYALLLLTNILRTPPLTVATNTCCH